MPVVVLATKHEKAHLALGVISEMLISHTSECQGRLLDKGEVSSMEKKKKEGYF